MNSVIYIIVILNALFNLVKRETVNMVNYSLEMVNLCLRSLLNYKDQQTLD